MHTFTIMGYVTAQMAFFSFLIFFNIYLFLRERERERERERDGRGRERGRQNPKQAPGSELSAWNPTWGSNP